MTTGPHPFQQAYADRDAAALLGATKAHIRMIVADADEVRNADLSGQFGGLYVRSNSANYNIDSQDDQEDDGLNVIIDKAGNHFIKAVDSFAPVLLEYGDANVSGGDIAMNNEADTVVVTISGDANLVIPAQAARSGRNLSIKKFGAGVLTPVLHASEKLDGRAPSGYAIAVDGGYLQLAPRSDGYGILASQL